LGAIGFALAFGLVWHIWWLVILCVLAAIATIIARGFVRSLSRIVPADRVREEHRLWLEAVHAARPITRALEGASANQGLAELEPAEVVG
ncbi:MAG: hypothetical protein ACREEH_04870, partial [Caulobacteraceae bacterium]